MVDLATNALTTLATVASDLGITTPGGSDDLLKRLINSASGSLSRYCQRVFERDPAVVENVAGYGTINLMVSQTPVNTLTSVVLEGVTVNSVTIDNAGAGLLFLRGAFQHTAELSGGFIASEALIDSEKKAYVVTYDGGYYTQAQDEANVPAGASGNRNLPWDIEEACIEYVRALYFVKTRDPTISSEKLLSWAASYAKGRGNVGANDDLLPPWVRTLIQPYVRQV